MDEELEEDGTSSHSNGAVGSPTRQALGRVVSGATLWAARKRLSSSKEPTQ